MVLFDKRFLLLKTKVELNYQSSPIFSFQYANAETKAETYLRSQNGIAGSFWYATLPLTLDGGAAHLCQTLVSQLQTYPSTVYPVVLESRPCRHISVLLVGSRLGCQ